MGAHEHRQNEMASGVEARQELPPGLTRMDMHCHSSASSAPVVPVLGLWEIAECYSPPEKVYDQARARGMDLVTITDHDTIAGVQELVERKFPGVVIGQEVTTFFPEDRCKLHVLVWGLTPELAEQITILKLREDVYALSQWLAHHNLAHSLAHPLYVQNMRLKPWHLERCVLLFRAWETLNGAHAGQHRSVVERMIASLNPTRVAELSRRHNLAPVWPRAWHKPATAGSDDHGLLNIGRTWTGVAGDNGVKLSDPNEFLHRVMAGYSVVGGGAGHSSLLAHQFATVGAHFYAKRVAKGTDARSRYIAGKLCRFAGVSVPKPAKAELWWHEVKRKALMGKKSSLPIVNALRQTLEPVLAKYPDLRARLAPEQWSAGAAISDHDRMVEFADELCASLSAALAPGAVRSIRELDKIGIVDHLISYVILHAAQAPYLFSLFHQNKERNMLERLEHDAAEPGSGVSVLERPMRVSLFTDTLGDVNGVCRFIQNVAYQARETGRDLQVVTSTSMEVPEWDNVFNFEPVFSTRMPKYEQLEFVLPPLMKILRHVEKHQPDTIHISTPGPVGLIGFIAAKMLRVPVLGVYHTDFPAYIDRLFDDSALTYFTEAYMRFFYAPFRSIFTRSQDYVESLVKLGMPREKMTILMPGLETSKFNASFRDDSIWSRIEAEGCRGVAQPSVKVLYVGRVSLEKNMPLLSAVWKQVHRACEDRGVPADLVIVGDGPYRATMQKDLGGRRAHFLGFRHGGELSSLYATSDLFVFPSTTDTLGQVVMESQSSGLPVLVTDQGGPKEVVESGITGYVLPADDTGAWVSTLTDLIADDSKRRRMGDRAARSMEKYDIKHSFENFWQVHVEAWHEHLATLGITPKVTPSRPATEHEAAAAT